MLLCCLNSIFTFPTCGFQLGSIFFTAATYSCIAWCGLVSPSAFQASLGKTAKHHSVRHSETAQRVLIVSSVEQSEQIHLNIFGGAKPSFTVWHGQLFSEATKGYCQRSTLLRKDLSGDPDAGWHSVCVHKVKLQLFAQKFCSTQANSGWTR